MPQRVEAAVEVDVLHREGGAPRALRRAHPAAVPPAEAAEEGAEPLARKERRRRLSSFAFFFFSRNVQVVQLKVSFTLQALP